MAAVVEVVEVVLVLQVPMEEDMEVVEEKELAMEVEWVALEVVVVVVVVGEVEAVPVLEVLMEADTVVVEAKEQVMEVEQVALVEVVEEEAVVVVEEEAVLQVNMMLGMVQVVGRVRVAAKVVAMRLNTALSLFYDLINTLTCLLAYSTKKNKVKLKKMRINYL